MTIRKVFDKLKKIDSMSEIVEGYDGTLVMQFPDGTTEKRACDIVGRILLSIPVCESCIMKPSKPGRVDSIFIILDSTKLS